MKVAVFMADGFEEIEAMTTIDILRRSGCDTKLVALNDLTVKGAHSVEIKADSLLNDELSDFDMVVLPGGQPGADTLRDDPRLIDVLKRHYSEGKYAAAICAAPIALAKAGILEGKKATCYPSFENQLTGASLVEDSVVVDGKVITSRGPATAMEFALTLVEILKGKTVSDELRAGLLLK